MKHRRTCSSSLDILSFLDFDGARARPARSGQAGAGGRDPCGRRLSLERLHGVVRKLE